MDPREVFSVRSGLAGSTIVTLYDLHPAEEGGGGGEEEEELLEEDVISLELFFR